MLFVRDVVGEDSEVSQQQHVSVISLIAQTMAALVSFPSARWSDRVGRKMPVQLGCFGIVITYGLFLMCHLLPTPQARSALLYAAAAFYGMCNGCFISVDFALALDTLPSKSLAATSLSIWGLGVFLGATFGAAIGGAALQLVSNAVTGNKVASHEAAIHEAARSRWGSAIPEDGHPYAFAGYVVLLSLCMGHALAAALLVRKVKSVN